jgi:hypothetical protein
MSQIKYQVQGRQDKAYKITQALKKTTKDKTQLNPTKNKEWKQFYLNLCTNTEQEIFKLATNDENIDPVSLEELLLVSEYLDGINTNIIKLSSTPPPPILIRLLDLIMRRADPPAKESYQMSLYVD